MPLQKNRIRFLLEAFTSKTATAAEEKELMEWISQAGEDQVLKKYMQDVWNSFHKNVPDNWVNWEKMFDSIIENEKVVVMPPTQKRFSWRRIAAAIVFLIITSVGGYFYFNKESKQEVITALVKQQEKIDVIAPQSNKAVLTLSDGSVIELDAAAEGALAIQGDVQVEKSAGGQIIYKGSSLEVKINTLTVPRGSKPVQLILADGSNVWLNVASSITYPTAFTGTDRSVEINGEAYFEIAHDTQRPFHVKKDHLMVEVLGTHFNVNTYDDEQNNSVTLLEGSVKVNNGEKAHSRILKPGQQAVMPQSANEIKVRAVDVDHVTAWKNGYFSFDDANIQTVMRQLSRWYNIEVNYEGVMPGETFRGKVYRNMSLQKVLEVLSFSPVNLKLEGRKLFVTVKN